MLYTCQKKDVRSLNYVICLGSFLEESFFILPLYFRFNPGDPRTLNQEQLIYNYQLKMDQLDLNMNYGNGAFPNKSKG